MDTDVIRQSITKNNYTTDHPYANTHWLLVSSGLGRNGLPAYWSPLRDAFLRNVLYSEYHDLWAGAVGIAITKMASLAWGVEGTQPRIRNYFQQLYLDSDGNQSWVAFIARHLQDFLCTDNGAFVEIVRASSAAGSRIIGLMHLDSLRCTRTGDAAIPVIYRDLLGYEHEVQAHQVIMLSDMPNPAASYHGVGLCATSRAWGAIKKMEAIEKYIYEKISGDRALALDLVKGIAPDSIRQAQMYAREDREEQNSRRAAQEGKQSPQGAFSYLGSVVVPVLDDTPLAHERIDFASLPDGFNYSEQFDKAALQFANAIGMDVQDLQPLTGRALGTGAQSQVLDEKSKGKGLAAWRQQWMHLNNQLILPDTVTFAFSEKDLRDQKAQAEVFLAEATAVKTAIEAGAITSAQGTQILADGDFIPPEFVPEDTTPQETITDDEKPTAETQAQTEAMPQTPPPDVTAKELRAKFQDALKRFDEAITDKEGWDESQHPRAEDGKFASGGGGGSGGGRSHSAGGSNQTGENRHGDYSKSRGSNQTGENKFGGNPNLNTPRSQLAAQDLHNRAVLAERGIRKTVVSAATKNGGTMAGLDFSVKTSSSIERKLKSDPGEMFDTVRFTSLHDNKGYTKQAKATLNELKAQGHKVERVTNYWQAGVDYKGVNVRMRDESGFPYELQFHTPQSIKVKEESHKIYEKVRVLPPKERVSGVRQMQKLWSSVPTPIGAGLWIP